MGDKLAPTPQALRNQAQRAIWLGENISDEQAKAVLLGFAQELLQEATQLEAAQDHYRPSTKAS
jgi:hypothetical protein